jgi:CubicO group peptidase (beta-lactamase class C family)
MKRKKSLVASGLLSLLLLPIFTSCSDAPASLDQKLLEQSSPAALIDTMFDNRNSLGETRALLIYRDGELISERYGPGFSKDSKLISWSMAKSITSLLVGFMVSDGRLTLDEPVPVPNWQRSGDPRSRITLRSLLHMSSGLEHVEGGDPIWNSDTVRMLFLDGASNMGRYAEAKPPRAAPNETYVYSSATSVILSDIMARTLTPNGNPAVRRDAMLDYIRGRLIEPLGITSLTPEFDASGTMIGGSVMHATARDYAKIGEFMRNRGVVNGNRLLPDSWFDFMLSPSPTNQGYGGHIWLNRAQPGGSFPNADNPDAGRDVLWPNKGPSDIFAMTGHQGQFVAVSPSQKLTVVRLGASTEAQISNVRDLLAEIMQRY